MCCGIERQIVNAKRMHGTKDDVTTHRPALAKSTLHVHATLASLGRKLAGKWKQAHEIASDLPKHGLDGIQAQATHEKSPPSGYVVTKPLNPCHLHGHVNVVLSQITHIPSESPKPNPSHVKTERPLRLNHLIPEKDVSQLSDGVTLC
jgi:hypothetical protein